VLLYKELLEASVARRTQARAPDAAPPTSTAAVPRQPGREAPPLHGSDGLASETLPPTPAPDDKPPLL